MKKKKTKSVSKLVLAAFLLAATSGGVAWGQAYINGANNVNNEFGAGESSTISNGQITVPGTSRPIAVPPNTIRLGSTSAKNIVINSYNSNGYYQDWMYKGKAQFTQTNSSRCPGSGYPGYPAAPADNGMSYAYTHYLGGSGTPPGSGVTHPSLTHEINPDYAIEQKNNYNHLINKI